MLLRILMFVSKQVLRVFDWFFLGLYSNNGAICSVGAFQAFFSFHMIVDDGFILRIYCWARFL